eukprot:TRINITY_DN2239_c0_g1_i1.p2 TRINITY_DN2239_c0_g1~~TRINITY_DN2239_c0_g1_i1.p2  ORF type:complete len:174 (-),score=56.20 TRINITY_DN2239_c0_g1_i1:85-606(-)
MPLFTVLYHTFRYQWEEIALASWHKYPNPKRPDVLDYDIVEKEFNPESGILKTKRVVWMKGVLPEWLSSLFGENNICCFVEDSTIDIKNKKMVLKAKNISFNQICEMEETCTYHPAPESNQWTSLTQEAKVVAFPFGLSSQIEKLSLSRFEQNAVAGRELMDSAIQKVRATLT